MKRTNSRFLVVLAAGFAAMTPAMAAFGDTVLAGDTASFRLMMFGDLGSTLSVNTGGNVNVLRGATPVSLGMNVNGSSNIMAKWDEITNPNNPATRLVVAELWTVSKDDMMPFGVTKNGENFSLWSWSVGATNAISFFNTSTVQLFSAKVQMIRVENNNAQTTLGNASITDLPSKWNGVDVDGQTKTLTGQGMNMLRLTYEIESVPGPAPAALAGIAGLAASRRRRR